VLRAVPAAAASAVLQRVAAFASGAAPPLTAFGLMQHESKLSVVNFSMRKAAGYELPIKNKEELLFVTGLRGWVAQPVLSGDDTRADKHKMERFLHDGVRARRGPWGGGGRGGGAGGARRAV
jgi:pre-rRNA-processing protein TSR1